MCVYAHRENYSQFSIGKYKILPPMRYLFLFFINNIFISFGWDVLKYVLVFTLPCLDMTTFKYRPTSTLNASLIAFVIGTIYLSMIILFIILYTITIYVLQ